jgi:hypothetical protein
VADLSLDKVMLQDIAGKKMVGAPQRREAGPLAAKASLA